jgi:hypothetical protein
LSLFEVSVVGDLSHFKEGQLQEILQKGQLQESILIDLSGNFDLEASIEYEYDQATYAIALDELTKDEDNDNELTVTKSHE